MAVARQHNVISMHLISHPLADCPGPYDLAIKNAHTFGVSYAPSQSRTLICMATRPAHAISRLAYAQCHGNVYYLLAKPSISAVLASTYATVAVDCAPAMRLLAPTLNWKWPVSETQLYKLGKAEDTTPNSSKTEFLRED